jgi:hypothetical protein
LGKNIAKTADLGRKKAGLSSDFWENCMILKKISIGKRPFFGVCYISRKITESLCCLFFHIHVIYPFLDGNETAQFFPKYAKITLIFPK